METTRRAKPTLVIVDDDPLITDTLDFVLSRDFEVLVAQSRDQARSIMRQLDKPPELALIDLGLPPTPHRPDEGFKLITELLAHSPNIKILVLSGQNDEANARHARTLGAIEFIAKPCEPAWLKDMLTKALDARDAEQRARPGDIKIIGQSLLIQKLTQQINQYASAPFPVLIEGESGSGKELVARSLHQNSDRAGKPFFALNCAAITPTLMEPTLFGHTKGAFTGAQAPRSGYFEDAADSTLFLDEIGDLPLELQAKLLRVLENGEFQRVGETHTRVSNTRVVAAANKDLRAEMKAGRFRPDLYHRLSVFTIYVPPLRDLGEDKRLLLEHFADFYARQAHTTRFELDPAAAELWLQYGFPGNIRELRNICIRLTTKYPGRKVGRDELQSEFDMESFYGDSPGDAGGAPDAKSLLDNAKRHLQSQKNFNLDVHLRMWEQSYVEAALQITHGNLSQASKLLGIHRTTLYSRMQNYERVEEK
ncbi:MAG: sigma-54 dependent transcriptional regulator [Burkholderiales bacterium]|nr:sigma-54 dependent transcriptional regulator [Burkholderiales bacterium]